MQGRNPFTPAYVVISNDLREKIHRGELAPGLRLPSERELCQAWDCSTITARHVMRVLRDEGLIHTVRGSGAFVAPQPERILRTVGPVRHAPPHGRRTYEQAADDIEVPRLQGERLSVETVEASAEAAERLGIGTGDPVVEVVHRATLRGEPVSAGYVWEPQAIAGADDSDARHNDPLAVFAAVRRFEAIGLHVDTASHTVCARMVEPTEVHQFKFPAGVPVVQIWQTLLAGKHPVQVAKIIYRADRNEFTFSTPIK